MLVDRPNQTDCPVRQTALIAQELERECVDIMMLSKMRFAEQGHLAEESAEYTFFWKRYSQNKSCNAGVNFAIRKNFGCHLESLPIGINERLMKL